MRGSSTRIAIAFLAVLGCNGSTQHDVGTDAMPDSAPDGTSVTFPASCLADGTAQLPPPAFPHFDERGFRMNRTSGAVMSLDGQHATPLGGVARARIENDRFVVRRGGQIILAADVQGFTDIAWDIELDGILYVSLFYGDGRQTYQALRLAAAPAVSTIWCYEAPLESLHGSRGGFATSHGPLLLRRQNDLRAIATVDGKIAWQVSWPNAGGPFTLLDAGTQWVACDRDIAMFDPETGAEIWRRSHGVGVATECAVVGNHIVFASRQCGATQCTPIESGALAVANGALEWSVPAVRWISLAAIDADRAVVSRAGGVAVLDARTGALGPILALPDPLPWKGELLPSGNVLLHGTTTLNVAVSPLAVRWELPYASVIRDGEVLLGTQADLQTGTASVVMIDAESGAELVRQVEVRSGGPWEIASTTVLGISSDEVDVSSFFGFVLL